MRITIQAPPETEDNRAGLMQFQQAVRGVIEEGIKNIGLSEWEAGALQIDMLSFDPTWMRIFSIINGVRSAGFTILIK